MGGPASQPPGDHRGQARHPAGQQDRHQAQPLAGCQAGHPAGQQAGMPRLQPVWKGGNSLEEELRGLALLDATARHETTSVHRPPGQRRNRGLCGSPGGPPATARVGALWSAARVSTGTVLPPPLLIMEWSVCDAPAALRHVCSALRRHCLPSRRGGAVLTSGGCWVNQRMPCLPVTSPSSRGHQRWSKQTERGLLPREKLVLWRLLDSFQPGKAGSWILQACLRAPGTAGDACGLAVWMEGEATAAAAMGSAVLADGRAPCVEARRGPDMT